jgi:hypothetical protein
MSEKRKRSITVLMSLALIAAAVVGFALTANAQTCGGSGDVTAQNGYGYSGTGECEVFVECGPSTTPCEATVTENGTMSFTLKATYLNGGTIFMELLDPDDIDCGDSFNHAAHVVHIVTSGTASSDKTFTLVQNVTAPPKGAPQFAICYQPEPGAENAFTDRFGNTIEFPDAGILAICSKTIGAPCQNKPVKKSGQVTQTGRFRAIDPKAH